MSEWNRKTVEVSFDGLSPALVTAIKAHVELYNLGSILSDPLMCIQTNSEKTKKGLFGRSEKVSQGIVVTPRWLIWAVQGGDEQAVVLSAKLSDVVVQDYARTQFAKMAPDSGIQINGRFTDVSENASAFIGLDDGAAAEKFKEMVIEAAQDAKGR